VKRRLIRWLLRMLGYNPPHFAYPELFVVSNGLDVECASTDRTRAIKGFLHTKNGALVRYLPAERILTK
jgi:hypothetical protein